MNTKTMKMPVIFFFVSAVVYSIAAYLLGEFPRWLGFVLLGIYAAFLVFQFAM